MAKKTENINSLISFSIKDKYVEIGDIKIFFYRFYPPNISILTDAELENEISSFGGFIEAAGIPIQIFAMDKVEDLSGNKAFFESLSDKYSEYTEKIVEQISSHDTTNGKTNSVQRAYYFVVRIKAEAENQTFVDALRNQNLKFATVERDELVTIFRNYFLREFSSFDLYTFDKDTNSEYAATKKKSIKKMGLEAYADFNLRQRLTPQRIDFLPRYILQNDFYRKVIMIKNFPSSISAPHILSSLSKIKSTTFSARLEQMSESKASTLINNQFNNQSSKRKSSKRVTEKIDAEIDEQNIEDFYRGLQESNNKIFLTNIFIEFYAEDEKSLNALERKIKNVLAGNKITYESLRFEQKEGFKSVNPLGKDLFLKSANNIPSNTLANLYPFSFSNRNDEKGLFLGETIDGGFIFLDFNLRSDEVTNGNFSIVGQSGQGKTWLMKKIASQMIFSSHIVFLLDPDKDYIEMIKKLGGTVINCASGAVKINPFEVRRIMADEEIELEIRAEDPDEFEERADAFKHRNIFYQHLSWLKEFFTVLFPGIKSKELDALMILIQETYALRGIDDKTDFDNLKAEDYPTFTDLYKHIDECYSEKRYETLHFNSELINDLLLMLRDAYDGSLGYILNGTTNISNSSIIDFDINSLLMGSKNRMQAVIFNIMTYVWNRIAQRKDKILFAVDELSLLIDRNNPIICLYLRDFIKRARKYEAIIGTATQQIQDVDDPEIRHITRPILANTAIKFLFYPDHSGIDSLKDMLKLTDGEIKCISKPKRGHCLLKAGDDKYYIKVGELPYEKELFGKLSG